MKLKTYLKNIEKLAKEDFLTTKEEETCSEELRNVIVAMRADMFNYLAEIEDIMENTEKQNAYK